MISVEGNIGAGKSFLCRLLKTHGMSVALEPVQDWTIASTNILDAFYNDPKKYACMFQTLVLRSRVEQVRNAAPLTLLERSVHSDNLFGTMQHQLGNMDDVESAAYQYQFQQAIRDTPPVVKYIYVDTPVTLCMQRMATRDRKEERNVPQWYLTQLKEAHDTWLGNKSNVLVLDGSEDWTQPSVALKVVQIIQSFLKE